MRSEQSSPLSSSPPPLGDIIKNYDPEDFGFLGSVYPVTEDDGTIITKSDRDYPSISIYDKEQPFPFKILFGEKWFVIRTNQADGWQYVEAESFVPHLHGQPVIGCALRKFYMPEPGHPAWCKQWRKLVTKFYTTQVYEGDSDNHPLRQWENDLMPYGFGVEDPNNKFHLMTKPFMEAFKILVTNVIKPEDWEGVPDTEFCQEVIFKIKVALQAHTQPNPMNLTYLFGNNTYSSQYQYLLGAVPPKRPYNYRTQADCPANWVDKPIKGFPNYQIGRA